MDDTSELRQRMVTVIPRLRRFARGLTGSRHDADDLVQVALEKALNRLHQFEPGTRLDSWLFRIVQNCFLDDRRRASRREIDMDNETLEGVSNSSSADHADSEARLSDIDNALATLSDAHRIVVTTVLVEGYSYREAADMLELPVGTVMSRLSRARKALQPLLSPEKVR